MSSEPATESSDRSSLSLSDRTVLEPGNMSPTCSRDPCAPTSASTSSPATHRRPCTAAAVVAADLELPYALSTFGATVDPSVAATTGTPKYPKLS